MSENLLTAHHQWANRPADERFGSLAALHSRCVEQRETSKVAEADWTKLEAGLDPSGDLVLCGEGGGVAKMSNWSFGQLAAKLGAPGRYLSKLSAPLAAECLNEGFDALKRSGGDASPASLLLDTSAGGTPVIRGITSPAYKRVWNAEITERVADIGGNWKLPMQYEGGNWSGPLVPGGAYVGDRDFFLFMVDESKRIADGSGEGLSRGFFIGNSDVGSSAFWITEFLYRHVCGNNIVWGASKLTETRIRHVGTADVKAFAGIKLALSEYAESSVSETEAAIKRAQTFLLGTDEKSTVEQVVKVTGSSQKLAKESYALASQYAEVDGNPTTLWGMVNGITRYSQLSKWTDERVEIDGIGQKLFARVLS